MELINGFWSENGRTCCRRETPLLLRASSNVAPTVRLGFDPISSLINRPSCEFRSRSGIHLTAHNRIYLTRTAAVIRRPPVGGAKSWVRRRECVERVIVIRVRSFTVPSPFRFHRTDVPPCSSRDIFAPLVPRYRFYRRRRHGEGGGVAREPPHGLFLRGVPLGLGLWPSPTGSQQTWTLYISPSLARNGTSRKFISRKRLEPRRQRRKRRLP